MALVMIARPTFWYGFLASIPREPALSKPTKAKMARTMPMITPPGTTPLKENCAGSIGPRTTQIETQSVMIARIEIDSRTSDVRAERLMS